MRFTCPVEQSSRDGDLRGVVSDEGRPGLQRPPPPGPAGAEAEGDKGVAEADGHRGPRGGHQQLPVESGAVEQQGGICAGENLLN